MTEAAIAFEKQDVDTTVPRLSPSIANYFATASPAHAREHHSKLNPDHQPEDDSKFDVGNVVHSILLKGEDIVEVIAADSWQTKAAKEAAAEARANERIPLLAKHYANVRRMCDAVARQLEHHSAAPALFTDGEAEVTLYWSEQGVECKGRLDWLRFDLATIDDIKTRSREGGAAASVWERALYDHGAHIQVAAYLRAVEALTGARPTWRWLVVETTPPYALNVITPHEDVIAMGAAEWDRAIRIWHTCIERDEWPAYSQDVVEVALPPWVESRFLERKTREELAA